VFKLPPAPLPPPGIRVWKCRITAASVLGIEIANELHKSGARLDPIVIIVSSLHAEDF
jgi:hypothetical protein